MKNLLHCTINPAACMCLGVGVLLSTLIAFQLYRYDRADIQSAFAQAMDECAFSLEGQIGEDIAILHSIKALFDASEHVTRAEFHTFASFLLAHNPSMVAVGWTPRVPAHERSDFELRARQDGLVDFQFTERQAQGLMVPAGKRDEYYPVYYIEPLAGNQTALAFNLGSNAVRAEALYAARDSGEARVTRRITLVQEKADQGAVLFFVPMYTGQPGNTKERRNSFQGVISGVFRLHDMLIAAGVHVSTAGLIDFKLIDQIGEDNSEMLYAAELPAGDLAAGYGYEKKLSLTGGRQWKIIATPGKAYIAGQRSLIPVLSLLVGLLTTAWLSHYLVRLAREQERVEQQVEDRTRELQRQSMALADSNANLKREMARRKRLQKRFAEVTDQEQRRLGQELHDSLGQQVAVAALMAGSLQERLGAITGSEARRLSRLVESIQTAQVQVRALSKGLLPVEIDPAGLRVALMELVESLKGLSDFDVRFDCDEDVVVEDNAVATQLYRITQEALRNALEHGEVSRITISIHRDDGGLTLVIGDNGKGFNTGSSTAPGSGLAIMRHRSELIGARLTIESPAEGGTSVKCFLSKPVLLAGR